MMRKLLISTDCTCDLPNEIIEKNRIEQLFFYVYVGNGIFRDRDEITAMNVFECMREGKKVTSSAPPVEDYVGYFRKLLRKAEEVIHLTISSGCSQSYSHACEALEVMGEDGKRIHLIDSLHLSTGLGHLVIKTVEAANAGKSTEEIVEEMNKLRHRISSSFIAKDAEYLAINGKIAPWQSKLLKRFKLHPILAMRNGEITVKGFIRGNHEKAQIKYVKRELKEADRIDRETLFITHAGSTARELENVKATVEAVCRFRSMYVTNASATVSSNCGPETVGVLFMTKE